MAPLNSNISKAVTLDIGTASKMKWPTNVLIACAVTNSSTDNNDDDDDHDDDDDDDVVFHTKSLINGPQRFILIEFGQESKSK